MISIKIQLHLKIDWNGVSTKYWTAWQWWWCSNSNRNGKQNNTKIKAKPKQSRRLILMFASVCAIEPWSISSAHLKGKCFSWMCKFLGLNFNDSHLARVRHKTLFRHFRWCQQWLHINGNYFICIPAIFVIDFVIGQFSFWYRVSYKWEWASTDTSESVDAIIKCLIRFKFEAN